MSNVVADLMKKNLERIRKAGIGNGTLVGQLVTMVCAVAREIKSVKALKELETRAKKIAYDMAKKPFDTDLKALGKVDEELRTSLLESYAGRDTLYPETGDGQVVIKQTWRAEVEDQTQLPEEYWITTIDMGRIQQAVDEGIRKIPGVRIFKDRSLIVYTEKKEVAE